MNHNLETLDFHIVAKWNDVDGKRTDKIRYLSRRSDEWTEMYLKQERFFHVIEFMIDEIAYLEIKMQKIENSLHDR